MEKLFTFEEFLNESQEEKLDEGWREVVIAGAMTLASLRGIAQKPGTTEILKEPERISLDSVTRVEDFFNFLKRKKLRTPGKLPSTFKHLVKNILAENSEKKLFPILKDVELFLRDYVAVGQSLKETVAAMFPGEREITKEWRFAMSQADWLKDMHCIFRMLALRCAAMPKPELSKEPKPAIRPLPTKGSIHPIS